ncbi:MAG: OstA-like protein [Bacteroidota bacterium]
MMLPQTTLRWLIRYGLLGLYLFTWTYTGASQTPLAASQDTSKKEIVYIDNANLLRVTGVNSDRVIQKLIGNVELSQDSIYMYCDSANLVNEVQLYAYSNVVIQQGDSIAAFSDQLDYNAEELIAFLRGNVALQNGDRKLYTDALKYNLDTKIATYATGGRLTDGETELRSTFGYYYTETDQIFFRDSVVVIGEEFEMRADTLEYDAKNEVVYFRGPTVIRTDTAEIYCESGYYRVQTDEAVFRQNAQYRSGTQIATADSIVYNGQVQVYVLEGQAYVRDGNEGLARAERIVYDKNKETYELQGNSLLVDSTRTVRGETVYYDKTNEVYRVSGGRPEVIDGAMILRANALDFDEATGIGLATGTVEWRDTSRNLTIVAERAAYNQETGYLKASGGRNNRPLLITILDGDSLFLTADTLFSERAVYDLDAKKASRTTTAPSPKDRTVLGKKRLPAIKDTAKVATTPTKTTPDSLQLTDTLVTDSITADSLNKDSLTAVVKDSLKIQQQTATVPKDTQQIIKAYRDVRIFKSDMQALCDSLSYNTTDSILALFGDPMLWQDTSELTADTINVYLKNDELDKVHLKRRALVVTSPDSLFFNQVKGKDIFAYFDSSALSRTDVAGNAEAIYYAQDDEGAYIGVNKTACSEMSLEFRKGSVYFIRFLAAPSGRLDPMSTINPRSQPTLDGRRADSNLRPTSVQDLFEVRTKPKIAAEEE